MARMLPGSLQSVEMVLYPKRRGMRALRMVCWGWLQYYPADSMVLYPKRRGRREEEEEEISEKVLN